MIQLTVDQARKALEAIDLKLAQLRGREHMKGARAAFNTDAADAARANSEREHLRAEFLGFADLRDAITDQMPEEPEEGEAA